MDNFEFKSFLKRRIITYSKRVLKEGTDYEAPVYGETLADTGAALFPPRAHYTIYPSEKYSNNSLYASCADKQVSVKYPFSFSNSFNPL